MEGHAMSMTASEFLAAVAADEAKGGRKGACGHSLGPSVDGAHHTIDGKEVCEDCYYDGLSALIDEHPIGRGRPHGGSVADD